jgi:hypothetical protein
MDAILMDTVGRDPQVTWILLSRMFGSGGQNNSHLIAILEVQKTCESLDTLLVYVADIS